MSFLQSGGVALLQCLVLAGCHAPDAAPPDGAVVWAGEQHRAVHDGDVGSKVRLADLATRPHLYAVGPLEDLAGEITVLDGCAAVSTVRDGVFSTRTGLDHGAAFLVWTHAPDWKQVPLPESVRTLEQIEAYLPEAARAAGFENVAPLAFRIEGRVEHLDYHVLSPSGFGPRTFETHERAKVHSATQACEVRMIGFYSPEHRGVFTPGTSNLHLHFVSADGRLAGHVEGFTLERGAVLLLPLRAH